MRQKQTVALLKARLAGQIQSERQAILARLAAFRYRGTSRGQGILASERTPTADFIEVVNERVARTLEAASAEVLLARLKALEAAAAKFQEGSYGICEGCRKPIPTARLRAFPAATLCVPCAEKAEQRFPTAARRAG